MATSQQERVADLRYRVALCTMQDVVADGDTMELTRRPLATVWAKIDQQASLPLFVSKAGFVVKEDITSPQFRITVRARVELDLTTAAWVYEERRKSPPRWYKVLGFQDDGCDWLVMICRLIEKSEQALPPTNALAPLPTNVVL